MEDDAGTAISGELSKLESLVDIAIGIVLSQMSDGNRTFP